MTTSSYFEGFNEKLFAAIPSGARSVLEFGCANGRLGAAYKQANPTSRWTGVDVNDRALVTAATRLDATLAMDLDAPQPERLGGGHDVIVMGDVLEHLRDPEVCLRAAFEVAADDARLLSCVPNLAHVSVIERMLAGDVSYDAEGLLDNTHLRLLSRASAFKMFLDAGWLPNLRDRYEQEYANRPLVEHLFAAAARLGIPSDMAGLNILSYQFIVDAIKWNAPRRGETPFSVVIPVTNRAQFGLNVHRSPGLTEVQAQLIPVEGAPTAAHALAFGRKRATHRWILYCHQDVYFPRGAGFAISAYLDQVAAERAANTLIGFAGLTDTATGPAAAGFVIDRTTRFDHPATKTASSVDEFAVALTADSSHELDSSLGWHLWGTDLCLAAAARGADVHIERVPLFHNSYNNGRLPPAFHASAQRLREKYPGRPIHSLCGSIAPPQSVS